MGVGFTKVNYSLRNNGGAWIVLPSWVRDDLNNLAIPDDIYAGSSIQRYPLGAKLYRDDKIYRYIKSGTTIAAGHEAFLKVNANYDPGVTGHTNVDGFEGALYAVATAADEYVDIADTTARAENYYEGAELVLQYDAGHVLHQYRVLASDVGTTAYVRCYIAPPGVKTTCPVSGTAVDAYMSRYSNVRSALAGWNCDYFSAVGAIPVAMTADNFYWLQTGGPITLTGTAGTTTGHRMVYPNTDGSVLDTEHVAGGQEVGVVFAGTISGYGTLLVYLTLDS